MIPVQRETISHFYEKKALLVDQSSRNDDDAKGKDYNEERMNGNGVAVVKNGSEMNRSVRVERKK